MLAPQKESIFGCSCRLWLLSWRRARVFARSCSLLSKYLSISWKQRKGQSHAQCHVTHRIRIFDKISEHVKVAKSVDIAVPELAVTSSPTANVTRVTISMSLQVRVLEKNRLGCSCLVPLCSLVSSLKVVSPKCKTSKLRSKR